MAAESKLLQYERKRAIKTALIYLVLTGVVLYLLTKFGPSAVTSITGVFVRTNPDSETSESTLIGPPQMDMLPEVTKETSLVVSGRAEAGMTVRLTINGEKRDILSNSQGVWSSDLNLHEGENTIRARVVNAIGNTSREISAVVVQDKTVPKLEITAPEEGMTKVGKKEQLLTLTGTTDKDASVLINDRVAIVNANGEFSININLNEGENEFKFVATDRAGNKTEEVRHVTFSL